MKILVLDDNPGFGDAFAAYACQKGHDARWVTRREDGLALLRQGFRPNALLVDLKLQSDMGDTFIRSLNPRTYGRHGLSVVAITADAEYRPDLPPGVVLLRKPGDPDAILAALAGVSEDSDVIVAPVK